MIESASDFKWLSKGDRVLIKLAMNSGNMFPSTTDPFILDGLLVVLKEKGAGKIMVCDQSGVEHVQHSNTTKRGSSRQLCDSSGLLKVISDHKVSPVFFEEKSLDSFFGSVPEGNHNWKKPIQIPIVVRETDHPAIYNFMKRSGGKPEGILWQSLNENPNRLVVDYIKKQINPDTV
jgi:uncharacterized protein (DUF362 family)